MLVAGVELGGTKCVCLLAGGPDDLRAEVRIETRDPASTLAAAACALADWQTEAPLAGIGIASFGPLDLAAGSRTYGQLVSTPKPGWTGTDVVAPFRAVGVPLELDTDVNGAALAEGRWGAAQGCDHFIYVTVGTGIGAGTIVHGRPIRGAGHSEAGHLRVGRQPGDTWPGACPFHGDCVEGLASGPAIEACAGRSPATLGHDDPVWTTVAHTLGGLLHNLVLTVAPQRIVIGGGIVDGQPQLLPLVRHALVASLGGYAHGARVADDVDRFVVAPALGRRAGPLGAVALGLQAAERAPRPRS